MLGHINFSLAGLQKHQRVATLLLLFIGTVSLPSCGKGEADPAEKQTTRSLTQIEVPAELVLREKVPGTADRGASSLPPLELPFGNEETRVSSASPESHSSVALTGSDVGPDLDDDEVAGSTGEHSQPLQTDTGTDAVGTTRIWGGIPTSAGHSGSPDVNSSSVSNGGDTSTQEDSPAVIGDEPQNTDQPDEWETPLVVRSGVVKNSLSFGEKSDATSGFDGRYDVPAFLAGDLQASFIINSGEKLWRDLRAGTAAAQSWELQISATANLEEIVISWDSSRLPTAKKCFLVDRATGSSVDMQAQSRYAFMKNQDQNDFVIECRR